MAPATYSNGRIANSDCGEQSRTAVDRYSYTDKTTSRDDSGTFVIFTIPFFLDRNLSIFFLSYFFFKKYFSIIDTISW